MIKLLIHRSWCTCTLWWSSW